MDGDGRYLSMHTAEDEAEAARLKGVIAGVAAMGFTEKHTKKAIRILGDT